MKNRKSGSTPKGVFSQDALLEESLTSQGACFWTTEKRLQMAGVFEHWAKQLRGTVAMTKAAQSSARSIPLPGLAQSQLLKN